MTRSVRVIRDGVPEEGECRRNGSFEDAGDRFTCVAFEERDERVGGVAGDEEGVVGVEVGEDSGEGGVCGMEGVGRGVD